MIVTTTTVQQKVRTTMAGKTSKTARASMRSGSSTPAQQQAATIAAALTSSSNRLIPLNGGKGAYLSDPLTNKTRRFTVSHDEFITELVRLGRLGLTPRLESELFELATKHPAGDYEEALARFRAAMAEGTEA